jgi:hypothetical protein
MPSSRPSRRFFFALSSSQRRTAWAPVSVPLPCIARSTSAHGPASDACSRRRLLERRKERVFHLFDVGQGLLGCASRRLAPWSIICCSARDSPARAASAASIPAAALGSSAPPAQAGAPGPRRRGSGHRVQHL